MKAKIEKIGGVQPWDGPNGRVWYYALNMDNGDKIKVGKKKEDAFAPSQEIEYEITGDDKNGWKKAKHITAQRGGYQREPFEERACAFALRYAVDFCASKPDAGTKDVLAVASAFNTWLRQNRN